MSRSVLFALASTRKNAETLQKLKKLWHQKQHLTLHGFLPYSVTTRFVEYSDMFGAESGASNLILEQMSIIICFAGTMLQGIANAPGNKKLRSRDRARQEG
jgi:hypothetical protein